MKLRDKKTGAIFDDCGFQIRNKWGAGTYPHPRTLKELNERFEDVEETKAYWCIDWTEFNGIFRTKVQDERDEFNKEIGNYFATKEEAEKAVEKLKAWKRLKDNGFKPAIRKQDQYLYLEACWGDDYDGRMKDLGLIFGGENE